MLHRSVIKKLFFIIGVFIILPGTTFSKDEKGREPYKLYLKQGWKIQKASDVAKSGKEISTSTVDVSTWYKATVPSTIMGSLTANGLYENIFVGTNIRNIDKKQFEDSWWYRDEFTVKPRDKDQHVTLHLDGVSYYANIWLNGKLIASKDVVYGAFRQFSFDVTNNLTDGKNILAIEVFKRKPGDFGIGFVDWNPRPPDENMGLWREVYLSMTGSVSIAHTSVESKISTTFDNASLTLRADVVNQSANTIKGILQGKINSVSFEYPVTLLPNETKELLLTEKEIPVLRITNPKLWWCNGLGEPNLYKLKLAFNVANIVSDSITTKFGIREVHDFLTKEGYRGYTLNGKKILIKGAGWTDDIFLRDTRESNEIQVQYVKHMNLNTIRLESIWGNDHSLYDLCDQYGIMIMTGWTCQWEWDNYLGKACDNFGGIQTASEMDLMNESLNHQVKWLRSHPSIIAWFVGSDKLPKPELERKYQNTLKGIDNRPYVTAAANLKSEVSGVTGVKMNGPYEYEGPEYWYVDKMNGGAFGFNTETGPGPQIPVKETIMKMIPQDKLWPMNEMYNTHCTTAQEAFNKLDDFNSIVTARLGESASLDDYIMKSELVQYDAMRAMFEAFHVNQANTTGIVQWMLNSAWPSFYWHLYDYYLIPTSAYYATMKANLPLQLMFNYGDKSIYLVNELNHVKQGVRVRISLFDISGKETYTEDVITDISPLTSLNLKKLPGIDAVSFLSLSILESNDKVVADNFYCISPDSDQYDWGKTSWAFTPMKSYADYKVLNSMAKATLKATYTSTISPGTTRLNVNLDNSSTLAFFVQLQLKNEEGQIIKPVFWSDNYISIQPNAGRALTCTLNTEKLPKGAYLEVTGWNVAPQRVPLK